MGCQEEILDPAHCHVLPREAMDSPFLEALETGLDGALSSVMERVAALSSNGRELDWDGL